MSFVPSNFSPSSIATSLAGNTGAVVEQNIVEYFGAHQFQDRHIACKIDLGDIILKHFRPFIKAALPQQQRLIGYLLRNDHRVDSACNIAILSDLRLQFFGAIETAVIADQLSVRIALFIATDHFDLLPIEFAQSDVRDVNGGTCDHQIIHLRQVYLFDFVRTQYQIIAAHTDLARRIDDHAPPTQIILLCALARATR